MKLSDLDSLYFNKSQDIMWFMRNIVKLRSTEKARRTTENARRIMLFTIITILYYASVTISVFRACLMFDLFSMTLLIRIRRVFLNLCRKIFNAAARSSRPL